MDSKEDTVRNLKNFAIILFLGIVVPTFIGYLATGFDTEDIVTLFNQYGVFLIGSVVMIFICYLVELNISKGDDKYGNNVFIHSPGESPSLPFFKFFEPRPLGFIFLWGLIFGLLMLVTSLQGQSFTGEVLVEQQFSPTAKTLFLSLLIPIAENSIAAAFGVLFLTTILRPIARNYKWSRSQFMVIAGISIVLIFGIVGVGNHQLRYGSSDLAEQRVFIFWAAGGLLTVVTGSFWPFFMMHMTNNLFFTLNNQLSSDSVRVFILIFLLLQGVGLFFSLRKKKKKNG